MSNRLSLEKSPYLLQHAANPVDWHPWGPEAFERARREDKPLLISIGYSTCHWCHVMERESFENPSIAALMNEHLVAVKVDREERPDVDRIYMAAVQALTGQGGWPLNIFISPDGKPFLGGTYFPPEDRYGRIGWPRLVERVGRAWKDPEARANFLAQGEQLSRALTEILASDPPPSEAGEPTTAAVDAAFEALGAAYDAERGGFSFAPKFPMPVNINFLLRFGSWAGTRKDPRAQKAIDMAAQTLKAMARGGIFDHLGGGFHRYATDDRWFLPHFEKMLYDNAQLTVNYLEATRATRDPSFAETARRTLDYLRRDMRHARGGFFSAEDADSLASATAGEKREGAFYVWTWDEIHKALGPEGELFEHAYGVEKDGNVLEDPHLEFPRQNVLFSAKEPQDLAGRFGGAVDGILRRLAKARRTLSDVRGGRPRPGLDDKILTSWNGLALSAFAKAHEVLGDPSDLDAAVRCAEFLRCELWDAASGRLYRRWREGSRDIPAQADDFAFLIQGLLDLYGAGFDVSWLLWAERLSDIFLRDFFDGERGAVYSTAPGHDPLVLVRAKEEGDNVEPSASSVAALNFLRLARLRDRPDFGAAARKILDAQRERALVSPRAFPQLMCAELFELASPGELVVAGRPGDPATRAFLSAARGAFAPFTQVILADQGPGQAALAERLPHLREMRVPPGEARAYFCRNGACQPPLSNPALLEGVMNTKTP